MQTETSFFLLTQHDANRLQSLASTLSLAVRDLLLARRQFIDSYEYGVHETSAYETSYEISKMAEHLREDDDNDEKSEMNREQ